MTKSIDKTTSAKIEYSYLPSEWPASDNDYHSASADLSLWDQASDEDYAKFETRLQAMPCATSSVIPAALIALGLCVAAIAGGVLLLARLMKWIDR